MFRGDGTNILVRSPLISLLFIFKWDCNKDTASIIQLHWWSFLNIILTIILVGNIKQQNNVSRIFITSKEYNMYWESQAQNVWLTLWFLCFRSSSFISQVKMMGSAYPRNLVLIVYTITLITGLPGNLLSLYAFIRRVKQGAKPTDMLLLSLNISDLIFLTFLPIHIKVTADEEWTMNYFLCPFSTYIVFVSIYNSTLHLTAVSLERYLGVVHAIKYKLKRHPRYAVITSVFIWTLNMAHCSIIFYMQYHFSDETNAGLDPATHNTCYRNFTEEQLSILLPECLAVSIVAVFVPLMICCFCYVKIIRVLYQLDNIKPAKRFRAIGLAVSTLLLFILCFMPFSVVSVVAFVTGCNPDWAVYAQLPSISIACLNPFVFYFSTKAMQNIFS